MFERVKNLRVSAIKEIEIRASQYPDVVSLAQGIPDFDTPGCIKRRVINALDRGVVAKYSLTSGLPELRELIEANLLEQGMSYDWQSEIIVTAGSIEGITSTILAITNPGDEILVPTPTYTSYREVITLAGCKTIFVPLNEKKGWAFEFEEFKKAITPKTKAIFYCNPNNPTGTIYSKEQLLMLANLAEQHNLFLISDEVYKDFLYGNKNEIFSLAQLPELRKRVIRIFSFSKAYAMTGWRAGYLHSDESVVKEIVKVHDSLVTCSPVISQYGAMAALEMGEVDLALYNKEYESRRELICHHLDKMQDFLEYVRPKSSYFVFPRLSIKLLEYLKKLKNHESNSFKFVYDLLEKKQVALVPGVAFGPNGENHVRISYGRSKNDINKAMTRIKEYFESM